MSLTEQTGAGALDQGLTQVRAVLTELGQLDLHTVPAPTVISTLDHLEIIHRQVEALTARALTTIEVDGRWALDGARSMPAWYRARSGRHHSTATRQIRQARALRDHLPGTATALAAGEISADHAAAMVRHTTDTEPRRDKLTDPAVGEDFLLDQARTLDASTFTIVLKHWGLRADPDAADRAYIADSDREEFYLAETTDGYVPGGWLSKPSGELLLTALKARTGTPATNDTRTTGQRHASALIGLAHLALDSGTLRPGARIRPHLAVHVPFDTLHRLITASTPPHHPHCPHHPDHPDHRGADHPGAALGLPPTTTDPTDRDHATTTTTTSTTAATTATSTTAAAAGAGAGCSCRAGRGEKLISADLDPTALTDAAPATFTDGTPLAPTLLARIACTSQLHRIVFGPDSQILDTGREERLFTPAQTRAIIARDRHCRFPHCNAPPGEGEIHHSIWWWAHNGTTSTKNGILLCWHHHDYIHQRHISIERHHDHWTFHRRDGTTLGHTPHNN